MCSHLGFWMFPLTPYNPISIYLYSLRSQNLCLTVPCEGKLNLLLYLFPLRRHSISNSEPPKHNQLSELQWQRMQNADKTLQTFFFLMKREKTIWFNTPGEFFSVSPGKRELFIASSKEKSIIPKNSLSCCPFLFFFFFWSSREGPQAKSISLCHMLCFAFS